MVKGSKDYQEGGALETYVQSAIYYFWQRKYQEIAAGESMAVDKDLLFQGLKEYAPDKYCIIPQTLNTMLSYWDTHEEAFEE